MIYWSFKIICFNINNYYHKNNNCYIVVCAYYHITNKSVKYHAKKL